MVAVAAVVLVVAGSLWWTKTIAFTSTTAVQFSIDPFEAPDDSRSQTFIAAANFPEELPSIGEASHKPWAAMRPTTSQI